MNNSMQSHRYQSYCRIKNMIILHVTYIPKNSMSKEIPSIFLHFTEANKGVRENDQSKQLTEMTAYTLSI